MQESNRKELGFAFTPPMQSKNEIEMKSNA